MGLALAVLLETMQGRRGASNLQNRFAMRAQFMTHRIISRCRIFIFTLQVDVDSHGREVEKYDRNKLRSWKKAKVTTNVGFLKEKVL